MTIITKPDRYAIRQLEETARRLEPEETERQDLFDHVQAYAHDFLSANTDAPAFVDDRNIEKGLDEASITEEGIETAEVLSVLREHVDSIGISPTSGRFLGYIPGGGLIHSALGDFLAAITNRYAGVFFAGPGAVRIENLLIRWMADTMGYPKTSAGYLASGGSLANLTALVTARDKHGLEGDQIDKAVIYLTEHAHHCIDKALHVAGLSRCTRRIISVDDRYRMIPDELDDTVFSDKKAGLIPWIVVASAGTTNTGTVDPLKDIGAIAKKHGLWYHIDGAYGAFFMLCPEGREILAGIDESDSLVLDPHKTLFLPYGTGALLVKDREQLLASFTGHADYMQDTMEAVDEVSPSNLSPELTKHFRGLRLWLPLKILGVSPFRAALSEKIRLARYFYSRIQQIDGFEVGPYPDLSVVVYRYVPKEGDVDDFNHRLMKSIQEDGRIFISSTRLDGKYMLRLAVGCFRTHLDEIDTALDILEKKAGFLSRC